MRGNEERIVGAVALYVLYAALAVIEGSNRTRIRKTAPRVNQTVKQRKYYFDSMHTPYLAGVGGQSGWNV